MSFKRTSYAVDTHAGEPMRVVTGGVPDIPGNTVYEKMNWIRVAFNCSPVEEAGYRFHGDATAKAAD